MVPRWRRSETSVLRERLLELMRAFRVRDLSRAFARDAFRRSPVIVGQYTNIDVTTKDVSDDRQSYQSFDFTTMMSKMELRRAAITFA
jgi:hypothetical protein